jgi:hypothetical protein
MPDPRDECRPVTLPTGEALRVRGAEPPTGQDAAALAEVVAATRRLMPEPDPGAAELYERLNVVRGGRTWREIAREAGVSAAVFSRLANGVMPGEADRVNLGQWLAKEGRDG